MDDGADVVEVSAVVAGFDVEAGAEEREHELADGPAGEDVAADDFGFEGGDDDGEEAVWAEDAAPFAQDIEGVIGVLEGMGGPEAFDGLVGEREAGHVGLGQAGTGGVMGGDLAEILSEGEVEGED